MAGERLQHNLGAVQERSKVWSAGRLGSSLAKGRETSSGTQIPRKCWSSTKSKATIFCTASGKVTRASSINLSGNKTSMEWQGTATANKVPSPQGHGNSLAILKHSNRSSFCHKETPSMPLVTSRHYYNLRDAPHDKCPAKKKIMLQHNNARHHIVRLQGDRVQTNGRNVSTRRSGPSFHGLSSYARTAMCDR
jgi:hypothetical protein